MQPYEEKDKYVNFAADEKARYRKKKRSDLSKAKARSNHKHIKKACLLICNTKHVYYANYCIICDKIINWEIPMVIVYSIQHKKLLELADAAGTLYRIDGYVLINREVFEEYLEQFRQPPKTKAKAAPNFSR